MKSKQLPWFTLYQLKVAECWYIIFSFRIQHWLT